MVRGPRCLGAATTVHHIIPSSTAPHLFWAEENLVASCTRCNYGHGQRLSTQNKANEITRLRELVWEQSQQIDTLLARISELERPPPRPRRVPSVY